jgi:hypothetical protein
VHILSGGIHKAHEVHIFEGIPLLDRAFHSSTGHPILPDERIVMCTLFPKDIASCILAGHPILPDERIVMCTLFPKDIARCILAGCTNREAIVLIDTENAVVEFHIDDLMAGFASMRDTLDASSVIAILNMIKNRKRDSPSNRYGTTSTSMHLHYFLLLFTDFFPAYREPTCL